MSMEFTKTQAEGVICPIMSRAGEYVNCKTTRCMAWEWSCQLDRAQCSPTIGPSVKTLADMPMMDGKEWEIDPVFIKEFTDGVNLKWMDSDVVAPRHCCNGQRVKMTRHWDDDRLGGCTCCTAKVADVDVSN